MKVFHGPVNIGGMAGVLARAQRNLGVEATSWCLPSGVYRYSADRTLDPNAPIGRGWNWLRFAARNAIDFDVFQFYFGQSLAGPLLWDVPWLRRAGKKIFFYFCGCDVRDSKATIARYPVSACQACWPMACSENRVKALETAARYASGTFVSTPDLLEFVKDATWLPQPVDTVRFRSLRERTARNPCSGAGDRFVVAHAPSSRQLKGTVHLERAVEALRRNGYDIELLMVENMPFESVLETCLSADIVVDQLLVGAYGQFAAEMMALGKPVICYLRDDLVPHYPATLPIINTSPGTIGDVLAEAYGNRETLRARGERGITYAEQVHDSSVVARTMLERYLGR